MTTLIPYSLNLSLSVNNFLSNCVEALSTNGNEWDRQWSNSIHSKLCRKYKLWGLTFDQVVIFI